MYAIDWAPRARRQLGKLRDRDLRVRILEAVEKLRGFPAVPALEALKEHRHGYGARVGRHHPNRKKLIDVDTDRRVVLVQEIRKRDERTY